MPFLPKQCHCGKTSEEGEVCFPALYQSKEKLPFTCCFSPRSTYSSWPLSRAQIIVQKAALCSSASLNHLVSMWSLTSLSTTFTLTLEKGPLKSTSYNLISAATPTEHLILKQGWLRFFGSLLHFILQIEKLIRHTYQIHPLQLFCV